MVDRTTIRNSSCTSRSNRLSRTCVSSIMRTGFFRILCHVDCFAVGQSREHSVKCANETSRHGNTPINDEANKGEKETGAVFSDVGSPTVTSLPRRRLLKMKSSVSESLTSLQQCSGSVDTAVGLITYQGAVNYQQDESHRDAVTPHDQMVADNHIETQRVAIRRERYEAHDVQEQVEQLTNARIVYYDEFVSNMSAESPVLWRSQTSHCILPSRPDAVVGASVELVERKSQSANVRRNNRGVTAKDKKISDRGGSAAGRFVTKIVQWFSLPLSKRDGGELCIPSDADSDCKQRAQCWKINTNDTFLFSDTPRRTGSDTITATTRATAAELFVEQPMESPGNEMYACDVEWRDSYHGNERLHQTCRTNQNHHSPCDVLIDTSGLVAENQCCDVVSDLITISRMFDEELITHDAEHTKQDAGQQDEDEGALQPGDGARKNYRPSLDGGEDFGLGNVTESHRLKRQRALKIKRTGRTESPRIRSLNEPIDSLMLSIAKAIGGDLLLSPTISASPWRLSCSANDITSVCSPPVNLEEPLSAAIDRRLSMFSQNELPVTSSSVQSPEVPCEDVLNDVLIQRAKHRLPRIDSEDVADVGDVSSVDARPSKPLSVWNGGRETNDNSSMRVRHTRSRQLRRESLDVAVPAKEPLRLTVSSNSERRDSCKSDSEAEPRRVSCADGRRGSANDVLDDLRQKISLGRKTPPMHMMSTDSGNTRHLIGDFDKKLSCSTHSESFTVHFDIAGQPKSTAIVAAKKNVSLSTALAGLLAEGFHITINEIDVFLASSKTPLPISSDCYRLAHSVLYVRGKDDDKKTGAAAATNSNMTKAAVNRDLSNRQTLEQNEIAKLNRPVSNASGADSDSGISSLSNASNSYVGSARDPSPSSSLPRRIGIVATPSGASVTSSGAGDIMQRSRVVPANRGHHRLQSLFNPFGKTQDKQEQLNEMLIEYSRNGLPKIPDLLTLGRPHYDPSAFHLERHWTDIVDGHELLSKRQRDQQEAIWELFSTEVEYIRKLRAVIDVFMCCLLDLQNEQLLNEVRLHRSKIESDKLFSNVCDVYYATCHFWVNHMSQVLRLARETRETLDPCLLKAGFLAFDKIFDPYVKYCLEQDTCRIYIKAKIRENELFKTFIEWCEAQQSCSRLKLVDLIVTPWQRLMKYKLLLYAMKKPLDKMEPTNDKDDQKKDINEMIEQVENFVHHVNIAMRQRHECKQLTMIAERIESYDAVEIPSDECVKLVSEYCKLDLTGALPGCNQQEMRILLLEGNLKLKDNNSKMDVYCFLFTDMLLITKPAGRRGDKVKVIRPPMRLDRIVVHSLRDVTSFMLLYLNEYHLAQAVYTFHGDSKLWLDNVTKAQIDYKDKRNQFQTRNDRPFPDLYDEVDEELSTISTPNVQSAAVGHRITANGLFSRQPASSRPSIDIVLRRQDSDSIPETFLPNCSSSAVGPPQPSFYSSADVGYTAGCSGSTSENVTSQSTSRPLSASAQSNDSSRTSWTSATSMVSSRVGPRHESTDDTAAADDVVKSNQLVPSDEDGFRSHCGVDDKCRTTSPWRPRPSPRRVAGRIERRYYTADTIRDLEKQNELKDSSIHKRLSLNYGGTEPTVSITTTRLGTAADDVAAMTSGVDHSASSEIQTMSAAFSSDSLRSGRSSSGVSSTASLSRGPTAATGDDISEETADELLIDTVDDADDDVTDDDYETLTARVEIPPPPMENSGNTYLTEVNNGDRVVRAATKFNKHYKLFPNTSSQEGVVANGRKFETMSVTSSLPCRHVKSPMTSLNRSATERQRSVEKDIALTSSAFHASDV